MSTLPPPPNAFPGATSSGASHSESTTNAAAGVATPPNPTRSPFGPTTPPTQTKGPFGPVTPPPTATPSSQTIHFTGPTWLNGLAIRVKNCGITPRMLALAGGGLAVLAAALMPIGALVESGVGSAALLLAAICLQLRFLGNLVEKILLRDRARSKNGEVFDDLLDRGADFVVFVSAGYSIGGGTIGPLLGWAAALLSLATSYVALLSSGFKEAATHPMNQKHRMAVMTGACV